MAMLTLPTTGGHSLSVRAKALVFEDPLSRQLFERIRQVAPSDATVLVTGETGTGKEIVARHIHELSRRGTRPFAALNCGAFSEQLVESELFGHERGSFTGALAGRAGWFESTDGGTLFLDEVGDLPPSIQVKLLRVLQESEVVRIGSRQPTPIDVRLIAATNVDLEQAMAAGRFREDLFYRLNVTTVALPPLRDRPGDILPLAHYFLDLYSRRLGVRQVELSESAIRRLLEHPWPGNVRELENAIHHALLVCQGGRIVGNDVRVAPVKPRSERPPPGPPALESSLLELFERDLPNLFEQIEGVLMRTAYDYCDRNQLKTARLLGISRNVVRARLLHHGALGVAPRSSEPAPDSSVPASAPVSNSGSRSSASCLDSRGAELAGVPQVLPIGYQKFGSLMLLKLHGALDAALARRGVHVEWHEFPAGAPIMEALATERLVFGEVGECPTVFAQAADYPIVYLAAGEPSPEGEAILVPAESSVRSVGDLRGKTVALSRGANVHYLLIRALEEANVGYDQIKLLFLAPDAALQAFERGEVDAWAIWDPLLAAAQSRGGARVLRDGCGLADNIAYYVANRRFANAHPDLAEEFLKSLGRASDWGRQNTEAVTELLAPKLSMPRGELALALRRNAGARPIDSRVLASQQEVADTLHRLRLIPRPVSVALAHWQRLAAP